LAKYGLKEVIFGICNSVVLWFGAGRYQFSFLLLSSTKVFQSAFVPGLRSNYSRTSPSFDRCNFMILRNIFPFLTLIIVAISLKGQVNDHNIRQQVLEKQIVESLFIFGNWTEKCQIETHLRHLGQVITKSGKIFKIFNSSWFLAFSHRATSRILIFNNRNQYVDDYYVTMTTDLPTKIENGKLIFNNTDEDCDKYLVTVVNLTSGLPKQFFRKCKG